MGTIKKEANIQLGDLGIYGDIRFDPSDTSPTYIGLNELVSASTASLDWKIYKFTTSGTATVRIQMNYGSWDGRGSIF